MPPLAFKEAVAKTAGLAIAYRSGLQAIASRDHQYIRCKRSRSLAGSVDIDSALKASHPDEPRWDYAVGIVNTSARHGVVWIEVHPASAKKNLGEVVRKLKWLRGWLDVTNSPLKQLPKRYIWVATGTVSLNLDSPKRRLLNNLGLRFTGSVVHLDDMKWD
jgi:hypothetical protein